MRLIAGSNSLDIGKKVADILRVKPINSEVERFRDGEIKVKINEDITNQKVVLLQSLSHPIHDNLMEFVMIANALKNAGVGELIACFPYLCYTRQGFEKNTSHGIKAIANITEAVGVDKVIMTDLHDPNIVKLFNIPAINVSTTQYFINHIKKFFRVYDMVIVSPDMGRAEKVRQIAKELGAEFAILDKSRNKDDKTEIVGITGEVAKKDCIIIDDIVDSGQTLFSAAEFLWEKKAKIISAFITHAVCKSDVLDELEKSKMSCNITNSIEKGISSSGRVNVVSIAPLIAKEISKHKNG